MLVPMLLSLFFFYEVKLCYQECLTETQLLDN